MEWNTTSEKFDARRAAESTRFGVVALSLSGTVLVTFKLACLTYKLLTTSQPAYLHMLLHHYTATHTLRSTNQVFLEVLQFGKRSFS